jgi:DNA-binding PadR family transcriptional regulator
MARTLTDMGRFLEAALLTLVSLAEEPLHGYGIMDRVEDRWGVRVGPGTLYAALARLERDGLIESLEPEGRRRPYRLTAKGRHVLKAELVRLRRVTRTGLRALQPA